MKLGNSEIYISYAWGGDSEKLVNQIDQEFQERGVNFIRDKKDLGFKGRIKEFMRDIGKGKFVIVVISDKYLKSANCMFELIEVSKNGQFYQRILPILLQDAQIYDPVKRLTYIQYWENKINELSESMKSVNQANLQGIREELDFYTEIRATIAKLADVLKDMNTLTPDLHLKSNFESIFQSIKQVLIDESATRAQNKKSDMLPISLSETTIINPTPMIKLATENDIGKDIKIGGLYQGFPLKVISSEWENYLHSGLVKSGWLYSAPISGISHAVAFFKIHLSDSGTGYIHILDASNPEHTIWLETGKNFREEEKFSWNTNKAATWYFEW